MAATRTSSVPTDGRPHGSTPDGSTLDGAGRPTTRLSLKAAIGLTLFGVWSWVIWLTFLKNIWADDRSWSNGPTAFFLVHLVLIVVSLVFGTALGWLGVRGLVRLRAARS